MTNSDGKALYYPYIHIQNPDWLKASLFYWDEIYRIVPSIYLSEDISDIKQVVDAGILRSAFPDEHHRERAKALFSQKIPSVLSRYEQCNVSIKDSIESELARNQITTRLINIQKIDYGLAQNLMDLGLAELRKEDGGFLRVDEYLGGLYMTCLASTMSEPSLNQPGLNAFSDSPGFTVAGEFISNDDSDLDVAASLDPLSFALSLDIGLPSPSDLRKISMEKIIDFNINYSDERKAFRNAIGSLQKELVELIGQSNQDLKHALLELRGRVQRDIQIYHFLAADFLGIPVYSFLKNTLRIFLLFNLKLAIEEESISDLCQTAGYMLSSEVINLSFRKVPFLPSNQDADVARYLLPVKRDFKRYCPTVK